MWWFFKRNCSNYTNVIILVGLTVRQGYTTTRIGGCICRSSKRFNTPDAIVSGWFTIVSMGKEMFVGLIIYSNQPA